MDANNVYNRLKESYLKQQDYYNKLIVIAQQISGKLALSRGDIASVMNKFQEKVAILEKIDSERVAIKECIDEWHNSKKQLPEEHIKEVESILENVENTIKKFMKAEEQLRNFIGRH